MGGPGDHWYTDIFSHRREAFGKQTDAVIRDIRRYGGDALLRDDAELGRRLGRLWSQVVSRSARGDEPVDDPELARLRKDLSRVRDGLRREAVERGWDVD